MTDTVDNTARQGARDAQHDLNNFKQIMEIRLTGIEKLVSELKSQLKWAGGLIVMLFISTLTWSLAQQYNANEAQKKDMQQQLDLLREQERARNANRAEILSRLPAGAAQTSGAASRVGQGGDLARDGAGDGAQN